MIRSYTPRVGGTSSPGGAAGKFMELLSSLRAVAPFILGAKTRRKSLRRRREIAPGWRRCVILINN